MKLLVDTVTKPAAAREQPPSEGVLAALGLRHSGLLPQWDQYLHQVQ